MRKDLASEDKAIMNTIKAIPGLNCKVALQECIGDLDLLELFLCVHFAAFAASVPVGVPLHRALQEGLPQAASINP